MIYICEKCNMVYVADIMPQNCEYCECTCLRDANDQEVMNIVASVLVKDGDSILLQDEVWRDEKHK